MNPTRFNGLWRIFIFLFVVKANLCQEDEEIRCSRTPLHSKTKALPPDNRFVIDIIGADDTYMPGHAYIVRLHSTSNATFIAFTIWATGSIAPNPKNNLKPRILSEGHLQSSPDPNIQDTVSKACPNTLYEANIKPKTKVEAQWIAPPKDNNCVTINAYVAVKPDVWYNNEGPLSRRICEDHRKAEDMKPTENTNCQVCEDARYELRFEGTWNYNTHPTMYPNVPNAKFSDIVGASHTKSFHLYEENADASEGMKMLAEQGNTTSLEHEILRGLGESVRTLIKATGPPTPSQSTISSFRTSREHHFISLAAAIMPSPDWFLGVYNLELCNATSGKWSKSVMYNLYPLDAGTDSGLSFEASAEPTIPPQVIKKADFNVPQDKMIPFAKLRIRLVRTYDNPNCLKKGTEEDGDDDEANDDEEESNAESHEMEPTSRPRPARPEFRPNRPPKIEPVTEGEPSSDDYEDECPMSDWEEDADGCQGPCEDNKVSGFKTFYRYYLVNGQRERESPKEICNIKVAITKTEECEVEGCGQTTTAGPEAQLGNWEDWVKPGRKWRSTG